MAGWWRALRRGRIRNGWRRPRCICRPGAPDAWRARSSSTCSDTDAVLLPRIFTLGSIDEDEARASPKPEQLAGALADARASAEVQRAAAPAAAGADDRSLGQGHRAADPAQAPLVVGGPASTLALADDLARLMDDMVTRKVDWRRARRTGAGRARHLLAAHAQVPERSRGTSGRSILAAYGRIEPAARRDLLIEAEAARLLQHREGPVIAAGSTGSMPTTAKFLHAIAGLPQGAVVLPGLDTDLDEEAWQLIGGASDASGRLTSPPASNHPQFALHALADALRHRAQRRRDRSATPSPRGREMLASETMRPSNATAQWHRRLAEPQVAHSIAAGMKNLAVIAAANPEMEALAIAIAMREARELEQIGRAGDARPRAGAAGDGGARALESGVRRFRRRRADGHAGRHFRPAGGGSRRGAARAGDLAGAAQASAAASRRARGRAGRTRSKRSNWRCCAAPGRPPGSAWPAAGIRPLSRRTRQAAAQAKPRRCIAPNRATHLDDARLDGAQALIAGFRRRWRRSRRSIRRRAAGFRRDSRSGIATRSRRCRATQTVWTAAFEGHEGSALAGAFDDLLGETGAAAGCWSRSHDYPEVFQTAFADRVVRRPEAANAQLADLRPAGSAADAMRPRHPRRAGRRHLAAGAADRSLAEPADAAPTRPRSAGAAHRPFRP